MTAMGSHHLRQAIDEDNDKILVIIQMNGGNDGLNTIIPLDKYDILGNVRSNILIPESEVLNVSDNMGLHPSMSGLMSLYDDAQMTVVQDVGYPNQNRSHFRSIDIWTSGSPAELVWTTGWLGRYLEGLYPDYPIDYPNDEYPDPFALSIGSIVSETCQGTLVNYSLAISDPLSITPLSNEGQGSTPDTPYGRELEFLRTTIDQANAYGTVISAAAEMGSSSIEYGDSKLARQLQAIALLISGGLGTKIYIANIGGFDTHANQVEQGTTSTGIHAALLKDLSDAVYAFHEDLTSQGLEERVLTMTFSEFGRRIRSNGSNGTDHGTAAPMMFFGSCVSGGIIGDSPTLPDDPGVSDGVPMQYDFRSVYGSVLQDWFDIDVSVINAIFNAPYTYIPIVNRCNQTTPTDNIPSISGIEAYNFPNPFERLTTVAIASKGGPIRISLFNGMGHEIDIILDRTIASGELEIRYDGSHLVPGNYFCRVISNYGVKVFGMIKV